MKKIGWVQITTKKYGGFVYGNQVKEILKKNFELEEKIIKADYFKSRYLKGIEWLWQLLKIEGKKDIWIRDSDIMAVAFTRFKKTQGKNIALVYHIDNSVFSPLRRVFFYFLTKFFYRKLKKYNAIITISEYYRNFFIEKGYSNVHKIYCSFDLKKFEIKEEEIFEFKKKYNLEKKPIIYIGNCQKAKGVVEVYRALKDMDVHLITSGECGVKVDAKNLNLGYEEYLKLLKASSVVITMSKFKEGWCMTAHEAMLCKTPVVGSGLGGMKELLEGGKQIICKDFKELRGKVEYLLKTPSFREKLGESGYEFAKNFTIEKFENEWINLVKKICAE